MKLPCFILVIGTFLVFVNPFNHSSTCENEFLLWKSEFHQLKAITLPFKELLTKYKPLLFQSYHESPCFRVSSHNAFQQHPKILLISYMSDDRLMGYPQYSMKINQLYALLHNHSFLMLTNSTSQEVREDPRWEKVHILRLIFSSLYEDKESKYPSLPNEWKFDYIVWIDSDLVFLDFSLLEPQSYLEKMLLSPKLHSSFGKEERKPKPTLWISSEYHAETGIANTGCFIIRNSIEAHWFLDVWEGMMNHSIGHDQLLFDHLYRFLASIIENQSTFQSDLRLDTLRSYSSSINISMAHSSLRSLNLLFNQIKSRDLLTEFINVMPPSALNSIPPAYLFFQEENVVLHLMGESDLFRTAVFQTIFKTLSDYFLHSSDLTPDHAINSLINREKLQEIFVILTEKNIQEKHTLFINLCNDVVFSVTENLFSHMSLKMEKLLSTLMEIRESLLLMGKFPPNLILETLKASYSGFSQASLNKFQEFRLFQYYDLYFHLLYLFDYLSSHSSNFTFPVLYSLITLGNDFITRFRGDEGFNVTYLDDPWYSYLRSVNTNRSSQISRSLPISLNHKVKDQIFGTLCRLFPFLISFTNQEDQNHGTFLAMNAIFLQNKGEYYFQRFHEIACVTLNDEQGMNWFRDSVISMKQAIQLFHVHVFPDLSSRQESGTTNNLRNVSILSYYYETNPVMVFELINCYAKYASILSLSVDHIDLLLNSSPVVSFNHIKLEDMLSSPLPSSFWTNLSPKWSYLLPLMLEGIEYFDLAIFSSHSLLHNDFTVKENHFRALNFVRERIIFAYKCHKRVNSNRLITAESSIQQFLDKLKDWNDIYLNQLSQFIQYLERNAGTSASSSTMERSFIKEGENTLNKGRQLMQEMKANSADRIDSIIEYKGLPQYRRQHEMKFRKKKK